MLTDLKPVLRGLRKSPGFTGVAVVTLALAIGANAAIFSVADAVLFRPLPYRDADDVLTVRMENRATGERFTLVASEVVQAIESEHRGVGEVARLEDGPVVTRDTPDGAEYVATASVTANYFQVLGVRQHLGRIFAGAGEDAGARAAMLSYRAWANNFGGRDNIVGRPLTLGQQSFDIVGILPPGFVFPSPIAGSPDLITVLEGSIGANPNLRQLSLRSGAFYPIVRLEPGVTREQAQAELETVFRATSAANSAEQTIPVFEDIRSALSQTGGPIMRYLLAGSLLLLLLGCANLANVLLVRGRRRERETGVRAALGATRTSLARPLLLEALILATAGSLAALMVARVAFTFMIGSVPPQAYLGADVGVDARVLAFTIFLSFVSAIAFSIAPAWRAARHDAMELIQRRGTARAPRAPVGAPLVAVQVSIAIVLVFGASVAGRAFIELVRQPIGFEPDHVLTVTATPAGVRGAAMQEAYLRLMERLAGEAGVVSVGATASLPRVRENAWAAVHVPGTQDVAAAQVLALPGYLETARIPLIAGRSYTIDEARADAPVAVVSERAARALFPGRDAVGATFRDDAGRTVTVVGVAADIRQRVSGESEPLVYTPPGSIGRAQTLLVRMRDRDAAAVAAIRRRASEALPGTVVSVDWWSDRINALAAYRNPRFQSMVLGSFAAIALSLTALGVFGVVSLMVAARTRELGIRLALGSQPRTVVLNTVRRSLVPVMAGIGVGLLATQSLARLAEAQLYDVNARDPLVLVLSALVVLLAGFVAAWVPARRAGRVNPMMALRSE